MRGLPLLLWQVYNLQDCQEDHPIRRAARALEEQEARIAKLEDEATRMMALARENGQLRDVARRERDALRPLALFGRDILEAHREDFGDIDGGTLQDTAERHGCCIASRSMALAARAATAPSTTVAIGPLSAYVFRPHLRPRRLCSEARMDDLRRAALIACCVLLAGCDPPPAPREAADQCLRAELFARCMSALPAGPAQTQYNDWSEVVDSCGEQAYRQSIRIRDTIKQECRAQ